jgi:hypothetical protein
MLLASLDAKVEGKTKKKGKETRTPNINRKQRRAILHLAAQPRGGGS